MDLYRLLFTIFDCVIIVMILMWVRWNSIELNYTEKGIAFLYFLHLLIRLIADFYAGDFWPFLKTLTKLYTEQYVIFTMIHRIVSPKIFIMCEIYSLIMNTFIGIIMALFLVCSFMEIKQYFDILVNLYQFVIFVTAVIAVGWFLFDKPSSTKAKMSTWRPKPAKQQKNIKMFGLFILANSAVYSLEIEPLSKYQISAILRKILSDYLFMIFVLVLILREKIHRRNQSNSDSQIPLM
jgi:hypothetical protein